MRTFVASIVGAILVLGVALGMVMSFPGIAFQSAQTPVPTPGGTTPQALPMTPTPGAVAPQYPPPPQLPAGPVGEAELRDQLVQQKQGLCSDLQLIAGIIISTGILSEVPPTISQLTGISIDELEARETAACQQQPGEPADQDKAISELLNEVRTVEWLVRVHLAAMDRVLMQNPRYRPINAQGSFAAFFEMHNINVQVMRERYLALSEQPTLEEARALASFWQEVLIPHAQAEDRALWPLARSVGDEQVARSADLLEAEHRTIDEGIARYMATLDAVERGQAQLDELIPTAQDVRIRTELHFGKEEESVVRPLQQQLTSEQFQPVVEEIDRAIGPWLREHGWTWPETAQ